MDASTQLAKNTELGDSFGYVAAGGQLTVAELQANFRVAWQELQNVITKAGLTLDAGNTAQVAAAALSGGYEATSSTPYNFGSTILAKRLFVTTGADFFDVNLPAASGVPGAEYTIHKADSGVGVVRINPNGSDVLKNGEDTVWVYLRKQYQSVKIMAQSGVWVVTGGNYPTPFKYTSPQLVGSGLSIATMGTPAIAALNSTDIAFIDDTNDSLRCYRFDGSTWSLVGSGLAITTVGAPAIAALSSTRIAFVDGSNDSLRAYDFNGSTWSLVGSGLAITGVSFPTLTAMTSTDVAFIDAGNDSLRCYRFNGSTWSLVGSGLTISGITLHAPLAALNQSDVAFFDNVNDSLRCYRFDGSTWSLVGSGLTIATVSIPSMSCMTPTDIALLVNSTLSIYRFNGASWVLRSESGLSISGISNSTGLASLNGIDIAFIDEGNDSLRTYRFGVAIDSPYHP